MALWRVERIVFTPIDPQQLDNNNFTVYLRDADTGQTAHGRCHMSDTDLEDGAGVLHVICNTFNSTYTPNDWNCT